MAPLRALRRTVLNLAHLLLLLPVMRRFTILRVTLQLISGLSALLLLAAAALSAFPDLTAALSLPGDPLVLVLAPAQESPAASPAVWALLGLAAAWSHLATGRGYRRLPFWAAALGGTLVIAYVVGGPFAPFEAGAVVIHDGIALLAGLWLLLAARVVMSRRELRVRRFLVSSLGGAILVVVLSVFATVAGVPAEQPVSYRGEVDALLARFDLDGRQDDGRGEDTKPDDGARLNDEADLEEQLRPYLDEIARDRSLAWQEQEELVAELKGRIQDLEKDLGRFEELREENSNRGETIARLEERIELLEKGAPDPDDLQKVSSYRQAVRPSVPLVRDFALEIAAEQPGAYYPDGTAGTAARPEAPSTTGLSQVLEIHAYVAGKWRYVTDPLFDRSDYYSPADRTIAAGLAGDCDDFAVLLASAVEAIGGHARILHGTCPGSAHAWTEVYVGSAADWKRARGLLSRRFTGRRISYIRPSNPNDYWLSLDWQVGTYSCGEEPTVIYQSGRRG